MFGKVESLLLDRISDEGCIHLALVDPEKVKLTLSDTLQRLERNGTTAILVGGSTVKSPRVLDQTLKIIRRACTLPTILFPNGPSGISRFANAIFFMSLLNSTNVQYLIRAQVAGAAAVKAFNLEPIPVGYVIVGRSNTAVRRVGQAEPVGPSDTRLAMNYGLAAQYLGMRFLYLEAGSGAVKPVSTNMVTAVSKTLNIPVIVGGGIRSGLQAEKLARAGASVIVTGTVLEQDNSGGKAKEILTAIRRV